MFFSRLAMRYSSTHKSSVGRYMPAIYIIQIYEDMIYFYINIYIYHLSRIDRFLQMGVSIHMASVFSGFQPQLGTSGKG